MQKAWGFSLFCFDVGVHQIDKSIVHCNIMHLLTSFSFAPSLFISEYRRINLQKVKHT